MKKAKAPSEKSIRVLLAKHGCPVAYHEVRTRFLGNIATPDLSASPIRVLEGLWGGELPVFDNEEDVSELISILINGLWNDLTRHQKRSSPFRLARLPMEATAANLRHFGLVRMEEINGFIEGLFNGKEAIDLPERAHHAAGHLFKLRNMMAGLSALESGDNESDEGAIEALFGQSRELTRIIETEIHEAVLSCTRARRQILADLPTKPTTLH